VARTNSLAGPLKAVPSSINTPFSRPPASVFHPSGTCFKIPIRPDHAALRHRALRHQRCDGIPLRAIIREIWPFMGVLIAALLILILFPDLVLWLPRQLGYNG
jgi:TRAP-type mannitol/chloroaromatic compound transport system permease large subunit